PATRRGALEGRVWLQRGDGTHRSPIGRDPAWLSTVGLSTRHRPADRAFVSTMYAYRAVDQRGERQRGVLAGDSPTSVAERVRRMGLRPVSVSRQRVHFATGEMSVPGFGGKKGDALAVFSRQFSTMIAAGTPILRC